MITKKVNKKQIGKRQIHIKKKKKKKEIRKLKGK